MVGIEGAWTDGRPEASAEAAARGTGVPPNSLAKPRCRWCDPPMRRALILLLPPSALALSVPWWWSAGGGAGRVLGFPAWGAYAIAAAVGYAVLVAVLVGRYWDLSACGDGRDGDHDDDRADRR